MRRRELEETLSAHSEWLERSQPGEELHATRRRRRADGAESGALTEREGVVRPFGPESQCLRVFLGDELARRYCRFARKNFEYLGGRRDVTRVLGHA